MKKNKKTYLLLVLVLAIWGILGFKIVGAINPMEEPDKPILFDNKIVQNEIRKRDTFSIVANYRDPFLGTMPKTEKPKRTKLKSVKKPQLPKKNIGYSGSVAQNGSKNRMFFVSIDGQQHIMSKNVIINDVKLVWGDASSIKVKYPGHTETIIIAQ